LLSGELAVIRVESAKRETLAEGPAERVTPQIKDILMCGERMLLTGPNAVLEASQLGEVQNNPLEVQREYFAHLVAINPGYDSLPFALAQVLRELGHNVEPQLFYDAALATANRNWLRKLPFYVLPALAMEVFLWNQGYPPWAAVVVGVIGAGLWFQIHRNRQRWLPIRGFLERADAAAKVDMRAAMAPKATSPGPTGS
jgi:hypothetical protein